MNILNKKDTETSETSEIVNSTLDKLKSENNIESGNISHTISPSISQQSLSEYVPIHIDYRSSLEDLKNKCSDYKKAHSYCKSIHFGCDNTIKVLTLLLSSLTTYYITSHNEEELTNEDIETDKRLTFATTIVSGIGAIFSFSDKSETHKTLVADYLKLYNEINHKIRIIETESDVDLKVFYDEHYDKFTVLNDRTTEVGLMTYAKNKNNIL